MTEDTVQGYPILLRLVAQHCVVVGGGGVAQRKVADLVAAGATVTVISPALTPALAALAAARAIQLIQTVYSPGMLASLRPRLVFAATNHPEINQQIAQEARAVGALVDVVDSAGAGDFNSMTTLRHGPLTVAISTGGASPALSAHLRERVAAAVGPEYGTLARWLAELRPQVREQIPESVRRRALWRTIIDSPVLDLLRQGDEATARRMIENLVVDAVNKRQIE